MTPKIEIRRKAPAILISVFVLGIIALIIGKTVLKPQSAATIQSDLKAVVIYAGEDSAWKDTYSHLKQSLLLNMSVDAVDVENEDLDFSIYDVI